MSSVDGRLGRLVGIVMEQIARALGPVESTNHGRNIKMHPIFVVDGDAPCASFDHVEVAGPSLTRDCQVQRVEDLCWVTAER